MTTSSVNADLRVEIQQAQPQPSPHPQQPQKHQACEQDRHSQSDIPKAQIDIPMNQPHTSTASSYPGCTTSRRNSCHISPPPPCERTGANDLSHDAMSSSTSDLKPRKLSRIPTRPDVSELLNEKAGGAYAWGIPGATEDDIYQIGRSKKDSKYVGSDESDDEDDDGVDNSSDIELATRRIRTASKKSWLRNVCLALMLLAWIGYRFVWKPWHAEDYSISQSVEKGPEGSFNAHQAPAFAHLTLIGDLPRRHIPGHERHRSGRLVIVGDVHGMKESLEDLLVKLDFDKHIDHLVLAGDMISKGPDSLGVVKLAMDLGATGIRGNHEDRVLLAHRSLNSHHIDLVPPGSTMTLEEIGNDQHHEVLADMKEFSKKGEYKDRQLAKLFNRKQIAWLEACPVILRVGQIPTIGNLLVVHGGLVPGVKLQKQDPYMVMNMRSIHLGSWVPSDGRGGGRSVDWFKLWNKFQSKIRKADRTTVVYGHDSKMGLQRHKYSRGIDSACLRGGRLTAVVIGMGKKGKIFEDLVSVRCPDGRGKK